MSRKAPQNAPEYVIRNKKASHRFEILERMNCGIALKGTEIKSLRNRQISLEEAFVRISDRDEMWLYGCHINPYEQGHTANHEPLRPRKLLAHRREIDKWSPQVRIRGLTIVPLGIYFNPRGLAKVTVALVRGKSAPDKRRDLKKRDHQREINRALRR